MRRLQPCRITTSPRGFLVILLLCMVCYRYLVAFLLNLKRLQACPCSLGPPCPGLWGPAAKCSSCQYTPTRKSHRDNKRIKNKNKSKLNIKIKQLKNQNKSKTFPHKMPSGESHRIGSKIQEVFTHTRGAFPLSAGLPGAGLHQQALKHFRVFRILEGICAKSLLIREQPSIKEGI